MCRSIFVTLLKMWCHGQCPWDIKFWQIYFRSPNGVQGIDAHTHTGSHEATSTHVYTHILRIYWEIMTRFHSWSKMMRWWNNCFTCLFWLLPCARSMSIVCPLSTNPICILLLTILASEPNLNKTMVGPIPIDSREWQVNTSRPSFHLENKTNRVCIFER